MASRDSKCSIEKNRMPKDEALRAFVELWDESTPDARSVFLHQHAPHLVEAMVKEYSKCKATYLPRGVLLALVHIFEGEVQAERDESMG